MKVLIIIFVFFAIFFLFLYIPIRIGKSYGNYLVNEGLMTRREVLEEGYLGMFFIKLFGI